jgi:CBS-domain-containing membrane protein
MSSPVKIVKMDMSLEDCCLLMEEEQLRRLPVVDEHENICGMITLEDIARKTHEMRLVPILRHISEPRNYV